MLKRHVLKRRVALQAGIVDQDVDCAERGNRPPEHLRDVAFGRDVALAGDGVRPGGANELNHFIGGRLVGHIVDDHICAGGTQFDRDGPAYAGVGPGYDRFLS